MSTRDTRPTETSHASASHGTRGAAVAELDAPRVNVEREFDASCAELFDAWVRPERLVQWFVPEHYLAAASECTIALEPGGFWSLRMADPDSDERSEIVTILSKVRAKRLLAGATTAVTRVGQLRDVDLKVKFSSSAGRCRVRVRQGPLGTDEQAHAITGFWSDAFYRLDDHLSGAGHSYHLVETA